jgi:hypothetical protein
VIDDDDDDVDLTPRQWSWWNFGSTVANWVSQLLIQTGNAFKELDEHLVAHANWQTKQREFAADVAKFIESIPLVEDNEKGVGSL